MFPTYVLIVFILQNVRSLQFFLGVKAQHHFQRMQGLRLANISTTLTADSSILCTEMCVRTSTCFATSFSQTDKICVLSDKWMTHPAFLTEAAEGWTVYYNLGMAMYHFFFLNNFKRKY